MLAELKRFRLDRSGEPPESKVAITVQIKCIPETLLGTASAANKPSTRVKLPPSASVQNLITAVTAEGYYTRASHYIFLFFNYSILFFDYISIEGYR